VTTRGRAALSLGALTYLAGWAFGSRPLDVVAVGLLVAAFVAWLAVRATARPVELRRTTQSEPLEGDDVRVRVELELEAPRAPTGVVLWERFEKLGPRRTALEREGRHLWARYTLPELPRGRYAITQATAVVEDPFGLARAELPLGHREAIVVYPRLVDLDRIFSEAGVHARDGRRLLLQQPTGYDLHSVREYVVGDSLRKVHWRTTARRGRLHVKELEDSPRDDLAVVLDAWKGMSSEALDVAVRASGSIARALSRRGRRAALVVGGADVQTQRIQAEGDWRRALELLAVAEATGVLPAERLLAGERNPAALALDLVFVTARLEAGLVERLAQRALARRHTAVVFVDANGTPQPALLRLEAAGVAVAVTRPGDDLQRVLGAPALLEAVHA
jgi:uncharacterized protein (DUF58 family)